MSDYHSDLQKKVLAKAKFQLEKETWYRGVCLDNLPSDYEITQKGIPWAVDQVVDDTAYWDEGKDLIGR